MPMRVDSARTAGQQTNPTRLATQQHQHAQPKPPFQLNPERAPWLELLVTKVDHSDASEDHLMVSVPIPLPYMWYLQGAAS